MKEKGTHWTEDLTEELKTRHAAGESMREISIALRITRNAVIGRLHRLGVVKHRPPRPAFVRPPISDRRSAQLVRAKMSPLLGYWTSDKTHKAPPQRLMDGLHLYEGCRPVDLVELTIDNCHFPITPGARDLGDWSRVRFCGAPVKGCGPYCDHHYRVAYTPAGKVNTFHVPGA